MQIIRDVKYLNALDIVLEFIARDSFKKSIKFLHFIDKHINQIPDMPYKYRQSYYYTAKNIRDLIVKGYTIPYFIDEEKQTIIILDIFKWSQR